MPSLKGLVNGANTPRDSVESSDEESVELTESDENPDDEGGSEADEGSQEGAGQQRPQYYSQYNPQPVDPQLIRSLRPEGFSSWTPGQKALYDQRSTESVRAQMWREEESRLSRERWISTMYAHEMVVRNNFIYHEQIRHHHDYHAGLPYAEVCPPVDWQALSEMKERPKVHYPQGHPSRWLPLHMPEEGSSSSNQGGVFNLREIHDRLMTSIFGEKLTPPYASDPALDYGYR